MTTTYPSDITPHGQYLIDEQVEPSVYYTSYDESLVFHIRGGRAPMPGVQNGLVLQQISGISPPFKHLMSSGAHQDGATWNDALYDPMEIDMVMEASALSAGEMTEVMSAWVAAWDPKKPGRLTWKVGDAAPWWADVRLFKAWPDQFRYSPRRQLRATFTHAAIATDAFWQSIDSVDSVTASGTLSLTNVGDQDGWPRFLCYGPGTFGFGNGPGSSEMITFGPLLEGQRVLITTQPRLRSVVDLTEGQVGDPMTGLQDFIDLLVRLVTFDQVPPLLRWFESLFGIRPPQGVLYSLLTGRFSNPIPGVGQPADATPASIAVTISGGSGSTKVIGALTPQRRWPEAVAGGGS